MEEKKKVPEIRFKGFDGEWEKINNDKLLKVYPFKPYISEWSQNGKYEVIQQGDNPIVGFADGKPFENYNEIVLFGDHTLSLYKPTRPFFVASDGLKILGSMNNLNGDFFYSLLQINKPKSEGYKRHFSILREMTISITKNVPEQSQIGTYFQNLDSLISLYQRKYDKLLKVKKAMLEKMFPKEGAVVPEIRFKGFEGEWVEKKFGETFMNLSNNTLSRANLNYNNGIAKNIHYGDVLIKFGELLDIEKEEVPFITDDINASKYLTSKLQNGDVIIADAAEDYTVGKCTELMNVGNEFIISGLHTIPVRPLTPFATGYLGYYLNSSLYHNQLLRLIQGSKVSSISKTAIKDTIIFYPKEKDEQTKISTFFQNLDAQISQHQKQLEKLKNIKKACLEKMFV